MTKLCLINDAEGYSLHIGWGGRFGDVLMVDRLPCWRERGGRRPYLHPREATRADGLLPGGRIDFELVGRRTGRRTTKMSAGE